MKSDVLIIGSTRFIGSGICNYMLQHTRFDVAGTDDFSYGYLGNLQPSLSSRSRFSFYPLNLSDSNKDFIKKFIDLISPKYVIVDISTPFNSTDILSLIKIVSDLGILKLLLITASEFAESDQDSLDLFLANNGYKIKNTEIICINPCEIYGPRQSVDAQGFAKMAVAVLNKEICVADNLSRRWLYIKDLFNNILSIMNSTTIGGGKYVLQSDIECSYQDVYQFMTQLASGTRTPLNFRRSIPTANNLIFAINNFDIESSVEHTMCWYADNKWAWR